MGSEAEKPYEAIRGRKILDLFVSIRRRQPNGEYSRS
jgi:hypothetical protein